MCSSAGWTDRKHVLYLSSLQESFVNRLHDGEISFKGLLSPSPRASGPKQPSKVDRAKSWIKAQQMRSPCCEHHQEDGEVNSCIDDDVSTTETPQESSSSQASCATSSRRQSSTNGFGKRKRSPSRTAGPYKRSTYSCVSSEEGSDQNFIDEDVEGTRGSGGSTRRRSNKRLKSAD